MRCALFRCGVAFRGNVLVDIRLRHLILGPDSIPYLIPPHSLEASLVSDEAYRSACLLRRSTRGSEGYTDPERRRGTTLPQYQTVFWLDALNLRDVFYEFEIGYTVGREELGFNTPDVIVVHGAGISEDELARRIDGVINNNRLPVDSYVRIRARNDEFEVFIVPEDVGSRHVQILWIRGERSRPEPAAYVPRGSPPPGPISPGVTQHILNSWHTVFQGLEYNQSFESNQFDGQQPVGVITITNPDNDEDAIARMQYASQPWPPHDPIYPISIRSQDATFSIKPGVWPIPDGARADDSAQHIDPQAPPEGEEDAPTPELVHNYRSATAGENSAPAPAIPAYNPTFNPPSFAPPHWQNPHFHAAPAPDPAPPNRPYGGPSSFPRPAVFQNQPPGPPHAVWPAAQPASTRWQIPQVPVIFPRQRMAHLTFLPAHRWDTYYPHQRSFPQMRMRVY
ncbi:hypothetical protein DFH06DRAFT_1172147 [Mycena polygramma]|nr:hypothetical protein DFH06DRAFT_1172147 [Mycena polygramma]